MPLYDFKCADCSFKKEHFVSANTTKAKVCPKCGSAHYERLLPLFSVNVEYSNIRDTIENKIDPFVKETHEKIGREATNMDTKTLDNLFGEDKVKSTFYGNDD